MNAKSFLRGVLALLILFVPGYRAFCQGTAFTYQGRLNAGGSAANGDYDFRFRLASDALGNNYVGGNVLTNAVSVSNGLFTVTLDFGAGIFTGSNLWLEVDVRTNGAGIYTVLSPLQPLTPTPYAITAENAGTLTGTLPAAQLTGALPSAQLSGTYSGPVSFINGANSFNGSFNGSFLGDGSGLTNVALLNSNQTFTGQNVFAQGLGIGNSTPFWSIDALAGQAVGRFITTNSGNGSVIELQNVSTNFTEYLGAINFNNPLFTTPGQIGYVAANATNQNLDYMSFRVGGAVAFQLLGDARGSGAGSMVGGYPGNSISSIGSGGDVIAGGGFPGIPNTILSNSSGVFIGAGSINQVGPNVNDSVIAGGYQNTIKSWDSVISGGVANSIDTNSVYSAIGGGLQNTIQSGSSVIAGGYLNSIMTNAQNSTIPGGYFNSVSAPYGFAAGVGAQANHQGATVFADGQFAYFSSTRTNEFAIRAQNGVQIQSEVGIHLNAADQPMIVRDWDVFGTNAPSYKAGIGRWGLFMEPSILTLGIPDDLPSRFFQVAKYNTNGGYSTLMYVDQSGNVSANNFIGNGANLSSLNASQLTGTVPGGSLSGTYSGAITLNNPGNSFTGNGSGLANVNAASLGGVAASGFALLNSSPTFTGTVTSLALITGNEQVTGLLRSGSESGTAESPNPAGLVVRRVNSTLMTSNLVVAVARTQGSTASVTLVRDGTPGGFQIQYPASPGFLTIACMGIDNTGAAKNFYTTVSNPGTAGTIQVYTSAQNVVHFECTFGITFLSGQHLTQVTLSRLNGDNFWSGNLNSTYNQ